MFKVTDKRSLLSKNLAYQAVFYTSFIQEIKVFDNLSGLKWPSKLCSS